jgi:hypothetical protein
VTFFQCLFPTIPIEAIKDLGGPDERFAIINGVGNCEGMKRREGNKGEMKVALIICQSENTRKDGQFPNSCSCALPALNEQWGKRGLI